MREFYSYQEVNSMKSLTKIVFSIIFVAFVMGMSFPSNVYAQTMTRLTQSDLLSYFDNETYHDYVDKYMLPYWNTNSQNWRNLVTNQFANRHSVEQTITSQAAINKCRERLGNLDEFTSTILPESYIKKIVTYINERGNISNVLSGRVIEFHGKQVKQFANYNIQPESNIITVKCYRDNRPEQVYQGSSGVVIGINRNGLINHFHGDRYANKPYYDVENGTIIKVQ